MKFLNIFLFIILLKFSSTQECGKVQIPASFSVGGEYSNRGQWPWSAPLTNRGDGKFFCGSTIISNKHLLSAAHCFQNKGDSTCKKPSDVFALLGEHDLENDNEINSIIAEISEINLHPEWKTSTLNYDADIALLSLKSLITFNEYVQPICLPESDVKIFDVRGVVSGYGLSENSNGRHENRPRHVEIPSVTHETCLFSDHRLVRISSPRMFCAGESGKNPCKGDSGSGFYANTNQVWMINGIVSSAISEECVENQFVLFTNVPKFIDWIKEMMKEMSVDDGWEMKTLTCSFSYHKTLNIYECYNYDFIETLPNIKISSIRGSLPDPSKTFSDVKSIIFRENAKLNYLPEMSSAIEYFPNLSRLGVRRCGLKYLERSKFTVMRKLTFLNLANNQIEELPEDVFADLRSLEQLALSANKIKILPPRLLWNLPKLREFWAWNNQVEVVPPRFLKNNQQLKIFSMENNNIRKIGIDFTSFLNLLDVDLQGNNCVDMKACKNCGGFEDIQGEIDAKCD